MTHEDLVTRIKDVLNEHGEPFGLSIADDTMLLGDYIPVALSDAVAMLGAKGYRVNVKSGSVNAAIPLGLTPVTPSNVIDIPEDFVRLLWMKAAAWKRAVTSLTEMGSPEYVLAMNVYTAPGINSPVVYRDGDTMVALPFKEDVIDYEYNATYDGAVLNADEKMAKAVVYMAAALVMAFFENDNGKQRLSELAMSFV